MDTDIHRSQEIAVNDLGSTDFSAHMRDVIGRHKLFFGWFLKSICLIRESRALFMDI